MTSRGSVEAPCTPGPTLSVLQLRLSAYLGSKPFSYLLNLRPSSRLHLWLHPVASSVFGDERLSLQLEPSRRGTVEEGGLSVMSTHSASLQQMHF